MFTSRKVFLLLLLLLSIPGALVYYAASGCGCGQVVGSPHSVSTIEDLSWKFITINVTDSWIEGGDLVLVLVDGDNASDDFLWTAGNQILTSDLGGRQVVHVQGRYWPAGSSTGRAFCAGDLTWEWSDRAYGDQAVLLANVTCRIPLCWRCRLGWQVRSVDHCELLVASVPFPGM